MARGGERRPRVDFATFWKHVWKPDGDITLGVFFQKEEFSSMFGTEAGDAVQIISHFNSHQVVTDEDKRQIKEALAALKKQRLNPKRILDGRNNAGVIRPPPGFKF